MRPSSSSRFVMRLTLMVRARTSRLRRERRCSRVTPFSSDVLGAGWSASAPSTIGEVGSPARRTTTRRSDPQRLRSSGPSCFLPLAAICHFDFAGRARGRTSSGGSRVGTTSHSAATFPPARLRYARPSDAARHETARLPRCSPTREGGDSLRERVHSPRELFGRCFALTRVRATRTGEAAWRGHLRPMEITGVGPTERLYSEQKTRVNDAIAFFLPFPLWNCVRAVRSMP